MNRLIRSFATSSCLFLASAAAATPQPTVARIGLGPADLSARAPAIAAPLSAPALPPADTGHFIVPFADPGFADTTPNDINDHGTMVGHFQLTPDFFATVSAFVFQAGVFTDVSPAAAAGFSELNGISQAGDAVGDFFDADGFDRGFLRTAAGAITVLPDPVPGVAANAPFGINSLGTIVGTYSNDLFATCTGWILRRGAYTTIDIPGAVCVFANAINDRGDIVGTWVDAARFGHGFLLSGNDDDEDRGRRLIAIDVPGANTTSPLRITDHGEIVGSYVVGTVPGRRTLHGFIRRGDKVLTLDNPAVRLTTWSGVTDNGVLVGSQILSNGMMAIPLPR
ncbi:MAG: hypothetical protein ACJ79G_14375 [Myxococcales bacterium]